MLTDDPGFRIAGHGVNAVGHESGNAAVCAGRTLAWLQDQPADNVWGLWAVAQRDCVILDPFGRVFAIHNLTSNDLSVPANYDELKALLLDAAAAPP